MDENFGKEGNSTFWKKNAKLVPGRASPKKEPSTGKHKRTNVASSFQDFQESVSDAWDLGDDNITKLSGNDVKIYATVAESTALSVLNKHSRQHSGSSDHGPICDAKVTEEGKTEVMQRLAQQSGRQLYNEIVDHNRERPIVPRQAFPQKIEMGDSDADREAIKITKFTEVMFGENCSLEALRGLSWHGIPPRIRPTAWKLLAGYIPANLDRREATLERKREEYWNYVEQYYHTRNDDIHAKTFQQIQIDIPRTSPTVALFQQKKVQEIFERVLFIWAIRHPASGYVQGINDLITPFFTVFLQEFTPEGEQVHKFDVQKLSEDTLSELEADSYWCMSHLLDGIQKNYIIDQPGIQLKVKSLQNLVQRIDSPLHEHLKKHEIDYLQFSFRWMNNLLMRELPLRCTIRLWDACMTEQDGFSKFHLYVCAAFLTHFSDMLKRQYDFQTLMLSLQNLPTSSWGDDEISLILAEAYRLRYTFDDAPNHLQVPLGKQQQRR